MKVQTEPTVRGRTNNTGDTLLVSSPLVGQCRRGVNTPSKGETYSHLYIPVVDRNQKQLMPTTPSRARRWIKSKEATPFWKKGVFCVRLNRDPSADIRQPIVTGIDPGSKKEGFTVKSAAHTYLNIQADAIQHVKKAMEVKKMMRHARRQRKTPCRIRKSNRINYDCIPPSTKARWQLKLRISAWLCKLFPITDFIVEDIKAKTKGKKKWDQIFSPLEIGKHWFYEELRKLGCVYLKEGWETKQLRDAAGLKKTSHKLSEVFEAHCVDSWVLANDLVGGHTLPDNKRILFIAPIILHRRQLYFLNILKGGIRKPYGGTRSLGFKRGSLIKCLTSKYKYAYVGGSSDGFISIHSVVDGKRLNQKTKPQNIEFKTYNTWKTHQ